MPGMAQSMIDLGNVIKDEYPKASEAVGRAVVKAGVGHVVGHGAAGEIAGRASGQSVGSEAAKVLGAGIIGGVVSGVGGLALTAALPVIAAYAGVKWLVEKLDK